jgi:hypothetical protein
MGYETELFVVYKYNFDWGQYATGELLASMRMSKIGAGPLGELCRNSIPQKPQFALWPKTPDRQQEAVQFLRDMSAYLPQDNQKTLTDLSNDIEDGYITKDKYNDNLGIMIVPSVIDALQKEIAMSDYRRFKWALDLITSIWNGYNEEAQKNLRVISYGY